MYNRFQKAVIKKKRAVRTNGVDEHVGHNVVGLVTVRRLNQLWKSTVLENLTENR